LPIFVSNFSPIQLRVDKGALWENFLVSERKKWLNNNMLDTLSYFWRTTQQQEIDYVENRDGEIHAYEFKWSGKEQSRFPITFTKAYPTSKTSLITPLNYMDFIGN